MISMKGLTMALIVEYTEMPESCEECFVDPMKCRLWEKRKYYKTAGMKFPARHPRCPLVPVQVIRKDDEDLYIRVRDIR